MPHAEIGIRHVRCDLLVTRRDECDAVTRLVEGVEDSDVAVTAQAEHVRNFAIDKIFRDDLGTLHPRHCSHPWLRNAGASHADLAFFKLRQCESDFNHIGWGGQYRRRLRGSSKPSTTLVRLTDQDRPETPRVVLRYFCLGDLAAYLAQGDSCNLFNMMTPFFRSFLSFLVDGTFLDLA